MIRSCGTLCVLGCADFTATKQAVSVFDCSKNKDGVYILDADPSIKCNVVRALPLVLNLSPRWRLWSLPRRRPVSSAASPPCWACSPNARLVVSKSA